MSIQDLNLFFFIGKFIDIFVGLELDFLLDKWDRFFKCDRERV